MTTPSINIAWSIAEIEAAAAGFESIRPAHFWIGCCKGCDLDYAKFLQDATPEVQGMEADIARDFQVIRGALSSAKLKPSALRRGLRAGLGKLGKATARPLHRHPDLRAAFASGKHLAEITGRGLKPVHVLFSLLQSADPIFDDCLAALGADRKALVEAMEICVLADGFADEGEGGGRLPEGNRQRPEPKPKEAKPSKPSMLARFGRDLTRLAADGKLAPVIGRKAEMLRIAQTLLQSRKNNVILVGEPGVGKTGIVEGLARRIAEGKVPEELKTVRIIELSMSLLVAGTKYRGEFEERMQAVIKEASADSNSILFLDEIHTLMGAGKAGGSMDAANILKPALARGEIRVIGATTTAEYRLHIEKDAALERRFLKVDVEEPSPEEALEILRGLRPGMEKHHGITITDAAISAAIEWSVRYLPDFRLPDKAIDLLDTACAQARFLTFSGSSPKGERSSRPLKGSNTDGTSVPPDVVDREQIAQAVASRCKVPVGSLTEDEGQRLRAMEGELGKRVKGQDAAIRAVSEAVRLARTGLGNPGRPVGSFLFVGPSGTGKTELAKTLAEFLFHSESSLIRFDMSEFMEEHSVSKLIGAPPGYKGCDEEGQLTGKVRSHPYSVVLFDEIEKAHPRALDIFLQIFDEGTLTDANGRKSSFRNAVIIMTSNLGSGELAAKKEMGFGAKPEEAAEIQDRMDERIKSAIKKHLRLELVNRLSSIVQFHQITSANVREIVGKCLVALNARLADRQITVSLSPEVVDLLVKEGFSPEYGARELERTIEKLISKPLAEAILSGDITSGSGVIAQAGVDGVAFRSSTAA
jgi:ATP-dependent Clp protease ATP-binding subunit ClpC